MSRTMIGNCSDMSAFCEVSYRVYIYQAVADSTGQALETTSSKMTVKPVRLCSPYDCDKHQNIAKQKDSSASKHHGKRYEKEVPHAHAQGG